MEYAEIVSQLKAQDPQIGYALIALATFLEYIILVLPAELLPTLGTVAASVANWSFIAVFIAGVSGSTAGAMLDYAVGRYMVSVRHDTWLHRLFRRPTVANWVEQITTRFARHGTAFLLINRFLPPIRMVVFVVAGMAQLPTGRVAITAVVASSIWMLAVLAVGYALGFQLEAAVAFLDTYLMLSTVVVCTALILLVLRARRASRSPSHEAVS